MTKKLPSVELLHKLLRYDAETGKLFWRERTPDMFRTEKDYLSWNSRYAGKEAFTAVNGSGYKNGSIFSVNYQAHRIVWAIVKGECPKQNIDHIDGDKQNNLISNLRDVSQSENNKNKSLPKSNKSGVVGASYYKRHEKFRACIRIAGKTKHIGYFDTMLDAVDARKAAEIKYGFHKNHGLR